ncbi:MAG: hypothetical protein ACTH3S_09085 [Marinobacter sp.]
MSKPSKTNRHALSVVLALVIGHGAMGIAHITSESHDRFGRKANIKVRK